MDSGGYRRDHLRALAQRVEVADAEVRIMGSKSELLRTLGEIAAHFKRVEPHSPVSFLLERAVSWADMPLDQWLAEVVNDDSVLGVIRDRIGVPRG